MRQTPRRYHQPARFIVSATCLVLASILALPLALAAPTETSAPLSQAFLEYQTLRSIERLQADSDTAQRIFGYIPPPIDYSYLKTAAAEPMLFTRDLAEPLPASYDLRSLGKVTPVKYQGSCGACWSFASSAALESALLVQSSETRDFSENNLKNKHGFDWGDCDGGNADMAIAYFARWAGPINEVDDPYNAVSNISPDGLAVQKHLQQALMVPEPAVADLSSIKQALMEYGALKASYYHDDAYYKAATYGYYYTGTASNSNHAITMVGWDDNYPASSFLTAPPGNGAFIIKNSWGTWWGDDGYFYISYHDPIILSSIYAFNNPESAANYSRVYQYDPLGKISATGYGSPTAWAANIFTAAGEDAIKAVSFHAASPGTSYTVKLYTGVTSNPTSGVLAHTQTGIVSLPGYHTIPLDSVVTVSPGQKFSVVMKLNTPGYDYPVPLEKAVAGYSSTATAAAGQSFYTYDSAGLPGTWTDATTSDPTKNVCIKAFSVPSQYTVSASAGANGSLSGTTPSPQSVGLGSTTSFTFNALTGYHVATVSGCNGIPYSNSSNAIASYSYTTGPITADCTVAAAFAINLWPLTIIPASTTAGSVIGGGTVTGSNGISCQTLNGVTSGTCVATLANGTLVNLSATANVDSLFISWSGGGCSGTGGCNVSLTGDTTITASFSGVWKATIPGSGYDTLTTAHDGAGAGATILAREIVFSENLTIAKPIILKGGYNLTYNDNSGAFSTLSGVLTIGSGSLIVENLTIR